MNEGASTRFAQIKGFPFLGSLLPIQRDALSFFTRILRSHGDRVQLRVLGRSILLLCNPQDIEHVLVRDRESFGRSVEIRQLRPIFGDGLLSSEGVLWRKQRKLIQPAFQHDAMQKYCSIMLSTIKRQVSSWSAGDILDIHAEMMKYTRDVICTVLFGEESSADQEELGEAVMTVFGDLRSEVLYLSLWRRLPFQRSRQWNRAVTVLNRGIQSRIKTRRASGLHHDDLLGTLLTAQDENGDRMSDEQLHDEILTFFLAGHETAALSLTWAAYLLARNPEVQRELSVELTSCGDAANDPVKIVRLPFANAVLKEVLRQYPPVWSLGREVSAETSLDGIPIKKGTDVWLCVHSLHHDQRWFPNPEQFLPRRWLEGANPKAFTYLPFGLGPRVCIGQHFATAEAVLALTVLCSRFHLELVNEDEDEAKPSAWITLRPKHPILLKLSSKAPASARTGSL